MLQEEKSVLLLTNVTNTHYDVVAIEHLKDFSKSITPYVKASCAVGVSGIKKVIVLSLNRISGRNIHLADNVEQAKDWLVNHP